MKISRWENPGIDVYSIPEICQPARNSPGIDISGNRPLGAPVLVLASWKLSTRKLQIFPSIFVTNIIFGLILSLKG